MLKMFFYLITLPLSWTNTKWAIDLYWKVAGQIWPEKSLAYIVNRKGTIQTMMEMGYGVQVKDDEVWAFNFVSTEFILAKNSDPVVMWTNAHLKACEIQYRRGRNA